MLLQHRGILVSNTRRIALPIVVPYPLSNGCKENEPVFPDFDESTKSTFNSSTFFPMSIIPISIISSKVLLLVVRLPLVASHPSQEQIERCLSFYPCQAQAMLDPYLL